MAIQGTSHFLLKARLQNHSKGRKDFFRKNETSIDLIYDTSKESIQFRRNTTEEKVKKVAGMIRDEIKDFKGPFNSWPPPSNEFLPENIEIPPLLYILLRELLTTGTENKRTILSYNKRTNFLLSPSSKTFCITAVMEELKQRNS